MVVLESGDGKTYEVKRNLAKQSGLINTMMDGDPSATRFPLPNVQSQELQKIIAFMEHHEGNPAEEIERPLKSCNMSEVVKDEWDVKFVADTSDEDLFNLILASNYIDFKPVLDLTCAKIASFMKGKTAAELRERFNIVNDLTPEYVVTP